MALEQLVYNIYSFKTGYTENTYIYIKGQLSLHDNIDAAAYTLHIYIVTTHILHVQTYLQA